MELIHDNDNWFTLSITRPEPDACYVEFKVFDIHSLGDAPEENGYGDNGQVDLQAVIDGHVNPEIYGTVKWDGCSNFHFKQDCFHYCSKEQAQRIGVALARVYDEAKSLMKDKWDD
jgi:hypothetical protein